MLRLGLIIGILWLVVLPPSRAFASEDPAYDELSIYLNIQGLGATDIDVVIKGKNAYLSVTALFNILKVKNQLSQQQDAVSGYFLNQQDAYLIDLIKKQVVFHQKTYNLDNDALIQTANGLYLRSDCYGQIFSLNCAFDFSTLSVNLSTKLELPVLVEKKREQLRKNIGNLNKEIVADSTVVRNYRAFNLGAVDWALSSVQTGNLTRTMASLRLGAAVAGGELELGLNYVDKSAFDTRQQYYRWRYVNNNNPLLRQINVGKLPVQAISTLVGGVIGLQLSNASTILRKSQGTFTLSNVTSPDWIVELYINDVLVDYKKADASGFFSFQVPIVYGTSAIKLRFLGPYGEEQFQEQQVVVPYNFLPKGEFEYTSSNGMVDDGLQTRFSRTAFQYGQSSRLTIGGGLEYLSKITDNPYIPFINASFRPAANLFLSAEHALNVRTKANASYRFAGDLLLEADYTKYKAGQQAVISGSLEDRKLMLSRQFRTNSFTFYSRLALSQLVYLVSKQTLTDLLLSCMWKGISTNVSTYALVNGDNDAIVYSNLALSMRVPLRLTLRPQAQYAYNTKRVNSYRMEVEKQLTGSGFLNLSFDHNLLYRTKNFNLGLRFDLSFVRSAFSVNTNKYQTSTTQSFSGGIVFDRKANYLKFSNRSNVGRSGLIVYPYLDLNGNHKRDQNEPKIMGLQLKINGGRVEQNLKDTTIRVMDLEPFNEYLMELNPSSFENIAWQMKNKSYKVTAEPNQLKLIEIPVQVFGEVSGKVFLSGAVLKGLSGMTVNVYDAHQTLFKSVLTDEDGYFDLLGLPVGAYQLKLDPLQLQKLNLTNITSLAYGFVIKPSLEGDVISNANFKLERKLK